MSVTTQLVRVPDASRYSATERAGMKLAAETLSAWWPERVFPVDILEIARRVGAEVLAAKLDEHTAAFVLKERNEDPKIWVERDDSANRQRFNTARMLGLYLRSSESEFGYIDYRQHPASEESDEFADAFAGALLLPADELARLNTDDEARIARHFQVPPGVARFHIDRGILVPQ